MLDWLFAGLLVLNVTGLFRFFAVQAGVPISTISAAMLVLLVLYLCLRPRRTWWVLTTTPMLLPLSLIAVWPILTQAYSPISVRETGLQAYFAALFLGTVVYGFRCGAAGLRRLLEASLVVSLLGLILSLSAPGYFAGVVALAGAQEDYQGRAFGFFLQPNVAGLAVMFLFLAWFALWRGATSWRAPVAFVLCLGAILTTGSRSAALAGGVMVAGLLLLSWRARRRTVTSVGRNLLQVAMLTLMLAGCIAVFNQYAARVGYREGSLLHRVSLLTRFRVADTDLLEDGSILLRLAVQQTYVGLILERPVMGYGLSSEARFMESGQVANTAHSTFLTSALRFGVPYSLAFLFLMYHLARRRRRVGGRASVEAIALSVFVGLSSIVFVVNGELLNAREYYAAWAVFFVLAEMDLGGPSMRGPHGHRTSVGDEGEGSARSVTVAGVAE